jgi:hypothetical protein
MGRAPAAPGAPGTPGAGGMPAPGAPIGGVNCGPIPGGKLGIVAGGGGPGGTEGGGLGCAKNVLMKAKLQTIVTIETMTVPLSIFVMLQRMHELSQDH